MSFLRHGEIYPCDEGTISRPCPHSSPWMSLQLVIPGRLLLQQSPLPLHQPELYCQLSTSPYNASAANGEMSLNWLSQPRGPVHADWET
jgi:hypothetical protein